MSNPNRYRIPCSGGTHTVLLEGREVRFLDHPELWGQVKREHVLAALTGEANEHEGCEAVAYRIITRQWLRGESTEERRLLARIRGVSIARRVMR